MEFSISIPQHQIKVIAGLLTDQAPVTSKAFWELIEQPITLSGKHAMYTGKEISTQLPLEQASSTQLHQVVPENLTCFPAAGDLLYTFMPAYAWNGIPYPIYDLGCFYGRDARTFFPMGWVPGNRFAVVRPADLEAFALMGQKTLLEGQQTLVIERL
jgi:hypothetical protein